MRKQSLLLIVFVLFITSVNAQHFYSNADSVNTGSTYVSFFSISHLNFFIFLSYILIFLLFGYLWYKYSELVESIEKSKKDADSNSSLNSIKTNNNPTATRNEFESLLGNSKIFEQFQIAFEDLRKEVANINKPNAQVLGVQNQPGYTNSFESREIFYMKYPVDNSFSNNHKSITKENTIYKFFLKPNKVDADFVIHTEGVKIDEIISMIEIAIKSGCNEDNNPTGNTRSIKTLKEGQVSLDGDKWVINRKALIRYE